MVDELLVDLNDLHGLHAEIHGAEEILLHQQGHDRHKSGTGHQPVMAEFCRSCLVHRCGVFGLDRPGELADLLAPHYEDLGVCVDHPDDVDLECHGLGQLRGRHCAAEDLLSAGRRQIAMTTDFDS